MTWTDAPWRDRSGEVSPLRIVTLVCLVAPALWVGAAWALGILGAEPFKAAIAHSGAWASYFLLLSLLVTPARQILRWARLATIRRMVGLGALAYAAMHLAIYTADHRFDLAKVASEITLRFYLTVGLVALLGLFALGATSTDGAVKRLGGKAWRNLHRLAYPIAALALFHALLQTRLDASDEVTMIGLLLWLLGYRLVAPSGGAPGIPVLLALAAGTALATAGVEAGWYMAKRGVDPLLVLEANLDVAFGLRPALVVGLIALVPPVLRALPTERVFGDRQRRRRPRPAATTPAAA